MQCTNCGKHVPETAKICGHCGHKLKADQATAPSKSTQTQQGIFGWILGVGGFIIALLLFGMLGNMLLNRQSAPAALPTVPAKILTSTPIVLPTQTLESTITPTIEAQPGERILLDDDFSDIASGWTTGNDGTSEGIYLDGGFLLSVSDPYTWYYYQYLQGDSQGDFDNFTLETDIETKASYVGYAGFVFRRSAPYNFYVFAFSPSGQFSLMRADQAARETWTPLVKWTPSHVIAQGSQTNRLKAVVFNSTIDLYVNGQYLTSVRDNTYENGWIGLFVARMPDDFASGKKAEYFFDNVKITYP